MDYNIKIWKLIEQDTETIYEDLIICKSLFFI